MAATKASPSTALGKLYSLPAAAVRIGLRDPDDKTTKGEKVLRDGVNLHGWPHTRIGRSLVFSEADLTQILALHRAPRRVTRRRTVARSTASAA
ncbi:hypothetical protein [Streptomyces lavendulae]|uniref:hypothetical protein n=1 Tax=Streptomyces lavendulae TaxID=1914 RepID=UPI0031E9ED33